MLEFLSRVYIIAFILAVVFAYMNFMTENIKQINNKVDILIEKVDDK